MRVISFKSTALFKRGVAFSAVALAAVVVTPALVRAGGRPNLVANLASLAMLGAFWIYVLAKTHLHLLADEVTDAGDHIRVHRGRTIFVIALADIRAVTVTTGAGLHRMTLHLAAPSPLGTSIDFLPQASLWSNLPAIERVAALLAQRADQARSARGGRHSAPTRAPGG